MFLLLAYQSASTVIYLSVYLELLGGSTPVSVSSFLQLNLRQSDDILTDSTEVGQIQYNQCQGRDPRPHFYRAGPPGPTPLHLPNSLAHSAAERAAEWGALASCFVEAPEHYCPQSPKLTKSSIWQPWSVATWPRTIQWQWTDTTVWLV